MITFLLLFFYGLQAIVALSYPLLDHDLSIQIVKDAIGFIILWP
jgi:hypothetical protein